MEINYRNITEVDPMDLIDFLYDNYAEVIVCKESALDISDLGAMQGYMGWCQNVMSFLLPLIIKMDTYMRTLENSKAPGSAYQLAQGKKNALNLYYDHLDRLYKTISRQCSLFSTQYTTEYTMANRNYTVATNPVPNGTVPTSMY